MMWKESYRLGVDRIDNQHIELFRMTEKLIEDIAADAPAEVYRESLNFLKDYVIYHFRDEEEYQKSISYAGFEEHHKEHVSFTKTVLEYEKKLEESGFDVSVLKDLAGVVTAWLIYHVADTDQKIVAEKSHSQEEDVELSVNLFSDSAVEVMNTMAGFEKGTVHQKMVKDHALFGDVFIELPLTGAWEGRAVFGFSRDLALNLVRTMTMMDLHEVDEMVISALCELTNISCGNASVLLAGKGIECDIKPPVVKKKEEYEGNTVTGIYIETGIGGFEVVALFDRQQ